jgi:aspartyl-tRNA(Asn)/glutamyl-tRNA(Gln) amidotransferase subunit A
VVAASLDRIERLQPRLNAFITVAADSARQAALSAEREIEAGQWRSPLHGIPIGIKDFYDTAGLKTTAGFAHFANRVPKKDAAAVATLKRAGAIVIGKTNMHTLGMGTTGLESHFGPARNPWNADYIPGGSSSGSAVAEASGQCYATLDTDAIGSCRLPAACCGVVGYKGTYGSIEMQGILDGEQPPDDMIRWLSHAAVTTRSISDLAIVLDVLMKPGDDGHRVPLLEALAASEPVRIGIADNITVDSDVAAAFERAVATLEKLGLPMQPVPIPFIDFRKGIASIERDRKTIQSAAFKNVDVMVLPTTVAATPTVKDAMDDPQALSAHLTMFANFYGLPAVNVPCGFDRRRLPVGLQIVGKPGDDIGVLRVAFRYEGAVDFSRERLFE